MPIYRVRFVADTLVLNETLLNNYTCYSIIPSMKSLSWLFHLQLLVAVHASSDSVTLPSRHHLITSLRGRKLFGDSLTHSYMVQSNTTVFQLYWKYRIGFLLTYWKFWYFWGTANIIQKKNCWDCSAYCQAFWNILQVTILEITFV